MADEMVTLERADGAQNFCWCVGYDEYHAESGTITVPVAVAATLAAGAQIGVYQVVEPKPPAPKKKVTPKSEDNE